MKKTGDDINTNNSTITMLNINIRFNAFKNKNMSDIWLGVYAKKNKIPLIRVGSKNHFNYVKIQKITEKIPNAVIMSANL